MTSNNILSADILDLIFENRNKQYGAYQLRKQYSNRLKVALLSVFAVAALLVIIVKLIPGDKKVVYSIGDTVITKLLPNVIADIPKPKQHRVTPLKAPKAAVQQWVSRVEVVPDNTEATTLSRNLDSASIGSTTEQGPGTASVNPTIDGSADGSPIAPEPPKPLDIETPRFTADIMPAYPGGMEALRKFLQRNLENPEEMEAGTVIAVKVRFVVGYDGKLKGFQTIEDGGAQFNNEVIRVLKKMPEWIPGKANGEKVSVYYTIPVKFTSAD